MRKAQYLQVMWEPFIEPWSFQVKLIRKYAGNALLDASAITDVYLKSTNQLNLNITEPLIEVKFCDSFMLFIFDFDYSIKA